MNCFLQMAMLWNGLNACGWKGEQEKKMRKPGYIKDFRGIS